MYTKTCIGCGQHDDHPKHTISVGDDEIVWHNDCHARATECVPCSAIAASELKGDELRKYIEDNDPGGKATEETS
jgi:hypothetical protein